MSINRVYIVRHGETDYNVNHRWQGHLDVPLNATGKAQAKALANHLGDTPVDAIFASDLRRTMDTVKPLATLKKLQIIPDKRLREIHLGVFQGLKRNEIYEAYPHEAMRWDADDNFIVPNGESRTQVQSRIFTAWQEITKQDHLKQIMLVSHGGAIRMLMRKVFPNNPERMHFGNTSITILERALSHWQIVALNTIPHLTD